MISYDLTATWSRPGVRRLLAESAADVAVGVLRTQLSVDMPWGSIAVQRVEGERLVRPNILLKAGAGRPETRLAASSGELASDECGLHFVLHDLEADIGPKACAIYPGRFDVPVPIDNRSPIIHRDWLATSEIPLRLDEYRQQLAEAPTCEGLSEEQAAAAAGHRRYLQWRIRRLRAEPHRRWANGLSCVAFTLLGAPLALLMRASDSLSTFFVAFLPVLLGFYPLLMVSEELACNAGAPGAVFWLADVALASIGLVLLRRVALR